MRIDDDAFLKQVQPLPPTQRQQKESVPPTPWPLTHADADVQKRLELDPVLVPTPTSASVSDSHINRHLTAGKILLALTALIIVTLIVSTTILLVGVGESRGHRGGYFSLGVTEISIGLPLRTKRQPPQPPRRPAAPGPAPDDDEINDAEIYKAVVQSMAEWSKVAAKKKADRERLQAKTGPNATDTTRVVLSRQKRDEEIVCYGELGCFRDEGPFDYLDMLPSPPEEVSTKFLLYTRKNMHTPQIYSYFNFTAMLSHSHSPTALPIIPPPAMSPPAPPVPAPTATVAAPAKVQVQTQVLHGPAPGPVATQQSCTFNASHPTKIIIHGFGSTCNQMWASEIRLSILAMTETNVICVDWENGAALPNYVRAAVNTRLVGKQVAMLIFWLNKHFGSATKDFHLIGFSLGAHVAGFAGQELKNLSRITGLDPAGPLFESYDPKVRLDSSDALFVDVIHSNGDSLLMGGLGSWEPMGHVDFYPNGGRVQKGCSNLFLGAVRDFLWAASDGDGRSLCNHRRAYKFFTESVSPKCSFPAFTCDSYDKFLTGACFSWDSNRCGNMGYYADQMPVQSKGILYLLTREDEPFCANQYRLTVESSPSPVPITTYGGLEAVIIGADFVNETFLITQTVKDSMVAGSVIQKLLVAHPAITEPIQIQLKYTAYQGWLYSGIARWSMDSLIITNAYGKSMSFCTRLLLPNGIPVTIRLTPGICLNRYTEPAATATPSAGGSNAIGAGHAHAGRPQYPPQLQQQQHGYEGNVNSITENSTSIHNAAAIAADLELSLMKPPRVVHHTSAGAGPGGGEVIGPSYHMTTGPGAVAGIATDWSQWHPVEPPATWAAKHAPNRTSTRTRYGTPVVLAPPIPVSAAGEQQDEEATTTSTSTPTTTATEDTTIEPPSATEESPTTAEAEINMESEPEPETIVMVDINETVKEIDSASNTSDAARPAVNSTNTRTTEGAAEAVEIRPTDLSHTESMELPVSIQICHFIRDGSNSNATATESSASATNTSQSQHMACVYPQDKLEPAATDVMSNNALGQIHSFQHIVDAESAAQNGTAAAAGRNTSRTPSVSVSTIPVTATSETEKISVLKQELHAQGSASGHNNDPDAMPPHLHYILQQLENEGLGPPGGSMVHGYGHGYGAGPGPGHLMNGNSLGHGHGARSLAAGSSFHDNHIQTDFVSGRQVPVLYNPNFHPQPPLFMSPLGVGVGVDPAHFVPGQLFMQPQPLLSHSHGHTKNPAVIKLHTNNRSGGGGGSGGNKTPNPSSRALKHRPVALTHGHGHGHGHSSSQSQSSGSSSGGHGRRSKQLVDISAVNLTPEVPPFMSGHHYPPPNAYARPRQLGPMLSLTLQPSPSAIPPAPAAAAPTPAALVHDNVMLASTTKEQQQQFIPRRIHSHSHGHSTLPFRPSRPDVDAKIQPPQPPIFYMTNTNAKTQHLSPTSGLHHQQQQLQRRPHFLFSHVPPREFTHQRPLSSQSSRRSANVPPPPTSSSSSSSSNSK